MKSKERIDVWISPEGTISEYGLPERAKLQVELVYGWCTDGGLPSGPDVYGATDFTPYLADVQKLIFLAELRTPTGWFRPPISSWQATLQTDSQNYVSCTIPVSAAWTEAINTATEFVIWRVARLTDGSDVEVEMARAPVSTIQLSYGPYNETTNISGYTDAFATNTDPDARYDRTLINTRSASVYGSGVRYRSSMDWLLRPGQRAFYADTSFIVSYMNMYATISGTTVQAYMDVGSRE